MPNKRKKGKKLLAGWFDESEVVEFQKVAESIGIPASDLLGRLIHEELQRKGIKSTKGDKDEA